jgi:hypothetical protein
MNFNHCHNYSFVGSCGFLYKNVVVCLNEKHNIKNLLLRSKNESSWHEPILNIVDWQHGLCLKTFDDHEPRNVALTLHAQQLIEPPRGDQLTNDNYKMNALKDVMVLMYSQNLVAFEEFTQLVSDHHETFSETLQLFYGDIMNELKVSYVLK